MFLTMISFLFLFISSLISVAYFTLFERKLLSYTQLRLGPSKTYFLGLIQPILDGIKLLIKINLLPSFSSKIMFYLSSSIMFLTMFLMWTVPHSMFPTKFSLFQSLFLLCVLGMGVFGLFLSGMMTKSKFNLIGGVRSSAQGVSYELVFTLMIILLMLMSDSLSVEMKKTIEKSVLPLWFFLMITETGRAPLDFSEGESELISGFNTEYSAVPFIFIFLSEYGMILALSLLCSILFFQVILLPFCLLSLLVILLRTTFPRFRFDMLMGLCWLIILPCLLGVLWSYVGMKL